MAPAPDIDDDDPTLTATQWNAVERLQRAFAACKRSGVVFMGMDSDVYCYSVDRFAELERLNNPFDSRWSSNAIRVDTHGAYKDSGGW